MGNSGDGAGRRRGGRGDAPVLVEGSVAAAVTGGRATGPFGNPRRKSPPGETKGVPEVVVPLRHRNDGWTPIRQRAFLRALSELGSVTDACKRVGMSRTSARRLRDRSPEFAAAWDSAASIVAPILEQAAYERGVEGWEEEVYQGGKLVGTKRRYSDASLRMLMQARERADAAAAAEAAGNTMPDLATASPEELEAFACEAAERAGGTFARMRRTQAEIDALLMKRIEAIVVDHPRAAIGPGEIWVEPGAYPAHLTVAEAVRRRAEGSGDQAQPSST